MRIKQRLSAIESNTGGDAVTEYAEPLVRLLGTVDSIFWPERKPLFNMVGTIRQRRQYLQAGTPWTGNTGGGSARAWKSDQRLRQSMEAAGLITLTKTKSNLPLVKLTPKAEHAARSKAGQPVNRVATVLLRTRLERGATENTPERRLGGFCSESWLFDSDYKQRPSSTAWDRHTVLLLPMLVAGVVESKPTTMGHIYYRLTDKPMPEIEIPESDLYVERLADSYLDSFFEGLQRRNQLNESTPEIIIPLSATS